MLGMCGACRRGSCTRSIIPACVTHAVSQVPRAALDALSRGAYRAGSARDFAPSHEPSRPPIVSLGAQRFASPPGLHGTSRQLFAHSSRTPTEIISDLVQSLIAKRCEYGPVACDPLLPKFPAPSARLAKGQQASFTLPGRATRDPSAPDHKPRRERAWVVQRAAERSTPR